MGSKKLNILVFSWRGLGHPNAGGAEISTHEHTKSWVKAGNKVTLFTSYFRGGRKREIVDGVEVLRKGDEVLGVRLGAIFWYLLGEHPKFDLVVDEFHGIPFFTPLFVRVKKIAWIHEVAKEVWWFNPWPKPFNLIPAVIGTVAERFIFTILYGKIPFMTVSKSTKRDMVTWGVPPRNITVIYNGVKTMKLNLKKEKKKTVIFLGALSKDKGIEDALRVFDLINERDKGWQFWVAGASNPSYLRELKKMCRNLGIRNQVRWWGYVKERKKFELLTRAHVMVNPSIREGWGLVNIEANTVGTPVVGYRVPGIIDSVLDKKTGILCKPPDAHEMANKILGLLRNKRSYRKLQRNAILWSRNFDWQTAGEKSLKLLERIYDN